MPQIPIDRRGGRNEGQRVEGEMMKNENKWFVNLKCPMGCGLQSLLIRWCCLHMLLSFAAAAAVVTVYPIENKIKCLFKAKHKRFIQPYLKFKLMYYCATLSTTINVCYQNSLCMDLCIDHRHSLPVCAAIYLHSISDSISHSLTHSHWFVRFGSFHSHQTIMHKTNIQFSI